MSFTREIHDLVCRLMKDKYNWDATPLDLVNDEWSAIVAAWWDAKVFYCMDNHYASLGDVKDPHEDMGVYVRTDKGMDQYHYINGAWVFKQDILQSFYRA